MRDGRLLFFVLLHVASEKLPNQSKFAESIVFTIILITVSFNSVFIRGAEVPNSPEAFPNTNRHNRTSSDCYGNYLDYPDHWSTYFKNVFTNCSSNL